MTTTPIAVGDRVEWTQVRRSYGYIVSEKRRSGTVLSIDRGWALIKYDGTLPYHGCVRPGKLTRIEPFNVEENVRWEPVKEVPSGRTGKVKCYTKNGKEYAGNIIWDDGGDLYSEMAANPSTIRRVVSDNEGK